MITAWTDHLKTEEEKTRFKNSVLGSKIVLERQKQILDQIEVSLEVSANGRKAYENPNWALLQADTIGYLRALKDVRKLINLDQKEH